MASITIRKLDDSLKKNLRRQAAENGRSIEAEAREILRSGVRKKPGAIETGADLFERIRKRLAPYHDLLPLEPFPDEFLPTSAEAGRRKKR